MEEKLKIYRLTVIGEALKESLQELDNQIDEELKA